MVLRNEYLSLLRAGGVPRRTAGFVLVTDPSHSLTRGDIAQGLPLPVVGELVMDPATARAIDAGQLAKHYRRLNLPPAATAAR